MRELLNLPQVDMELDVGKAVVIVPIVGQKRIQIAQNYQTDYIVVLVVD